MTVGTIEPEQQALLKRRGDLSKVLWQVGVAFNLVKDAFELEESGEYVSPDEVKTRQSLLELMRRKLVLMIETDEKWSSVLLGDEKDKHEISLRYGVIRREVHDHSLVVTFDPTNVEGDPVSETYPLPLP